MRGKGRNSFFTSRSFISRSWQKRSRKTNQGELKKMSLSPEEIEDGEDETSGDKDNGSRDEVDVPQKNGKEPQGPSWQKTGGVPCSRTMRSDMRTLRRMTEEIEAQRSYVTYRISHRRWQGQDLSPAFWLQRIASIDFKSQADAERALEEQQGTEIGGLAVVLELVGAKSQGQEERDGKKVQLAN
eukprot:XP_028338415.1 nucleolin-like isoform X2 [Physeter catodon]